VKSDPAKFVLSASENTATLTVLATSLGETGTLDLAIRFPVRRFAKLAVPAEAAVRRVQNGNYHHS
jgi:hypothetical protein